MNLAVDLRPLLTQPKTGVGLYTESILRACHKADFAKDVEISLVSSGWSDVRRRADKIADTLRFKHRHIHIPNRIINALWLGAHGPSPDFFLTDIDYIWLPNINFFSASTRLPYAITIHDLSFLHSSSYFRARSALWHRLIDIERLVTSASLIFAVSEHTRSDLAKFFPRLDSQKVFCILPAIHPHNDEHGYRLEPASTCDLPDNYLLYVGTVEARKNVRAIIQAFTILERKYPDLHLVIAGARGNIHASAFKQMQQVPRVTYLKYVSEEHKRSLFRSAIACIWPSLYEGFGFPPLESLHAGTPVITSYRTSLPEILRHHALYVNPFNPGELAHVIDQLLQHPKAAFLSGPFKRDRRWSHTASDIISTIKTDYENRH